MRKCIDCFNLRAKIPLGKDGLINFHKIKRVWCAKGLVPSLEGTMTLKEITSVALLTEPRQCEFWEGEEGEERDHAR